MTREEYDRRRAWLVEVLNDATERGDYHLEMDTRGMIELLDADWYKEDEE